MLYQEDIKKGQEMFGGESPRFGPIGFDFKEVFGKDHSELTRTFSVALRFEIE